MELVDLSGRTKGRLGYILAYTATRIRGPHYEPDYGPSYALWTTLQIELRSDARRTNNCYCATAPLDRQTYNAGYMHIEIEAPRPWCAGSNESY